MKASKAYTKGLEARINSLETDLSTLTWLHAELAAGFKAFIAAIALAQVLQQAEQAKNEADPRPEQLNAD